MPDIFFTAAGLVGAAIVLLAYFLLAAEKMRSDGYTYPLMNMLGSIGVLVSLTHQWNLASAIINSIWVIISLIAIARHYLKQRQS
jgi:hypothetical protein